MPNALTPEEIEKTVLAELNAGISPNRLMVQAIRRSVELARL